MTAQIRYQWGDGPILDDPVPPTATVATLWVRDQPVSCADVSPQLASWARWCALSLTHLWRCPEPTRRFLQTGAASQLPGALEAYRIAAARARPPERPAARATLHALTTIDSSPGAQTLAQRATLAARAAVDVLSRDVLESDWETWSLPLARRAELDAQREQSAHLRRLLLQRALPSPLWPLIEPASSHTLDRSSAQQVLCDWLLANAHR